MKQLFGLLIRDDSGQDLIEYALLAGFAAIAAIAAATVLGPAIATKFGDIVTALGG